MPHPDFVAFGTTLDSFLPPEFIEPTQFYDRSADTSPTWGLCAAILIQAVAEYRAAPCHRTHGARVCRRCRNRADAEDFFLGKNNSTFGWVCAVLHLSPHYVWRAVKTVVVVTRTHIHPSNPRNFRVNGKARNYDTRKPHTRALTTRVVV